MSERPPPKKRVLNIAHNINHGFNCVCNTVNHRSNRIRNNFQESLFDMLSSGSRLEFFVNGFEKGDIFLLGKSKNDLVYQFGQVVLFVGRDGNYFRGG